MINSFEVYQKHFRMYGGEVETVTLKCRNDMANVIVDQFGKDVEFYNAKAEPRYAYKHTIGKQEQYTYSRQFVDFIYDEIKKNPQHFVESLKKSKKITPGT
ncbi:MAG: hypothetical protein J6M65_00045 [Eubacterium sp.]|nr:hypothetical protein [Eubacterium sp.]